MIYFVVEGVGRSAISLFLYDWGKSVAENVRIIDYQTLLRQKKLQIGTYIFTGTEHLDNPSLEAVARCWQTLRDANPDLNLLNHPLRSMRRYELLRTLFESGINDFDIYKLNQARKPKRFPVFIRGENDHLGVTSRLIESQQQLDNTISEMIYKRHSLYQYVITEFCDISDSNGNYRKYGAFYINGSVIPRHLQVGHEWMVKGSSREFDENALREELDYIETNPHEAQLRGICQLANIDYGRVDYSVSDEKIVVFEINTNPQLVMPGESKNIQRTCIKKHFSENLISVFNKINHPLNKPGSVSIDMTTRPYLNLRPPLLESAMILSNRIGLSRFQPIIYSYLRSIMPKIHDYLSAIKHLWKKICS